MKKIILFAILFMMFVPQTFAIFVDAININTIRTNNLVYDEVKPGDTIKIDTSFDNWGVYNVKKATIRVTEYELGISRKIGPFKGPKSDKGMLKSVLLIIPEDAKPGVYTLRMTLTTDNQVKRVRHRDFRVI